MVFFVLRSTMDFEISPSQFRKMKLLLYAVSVCVFLYPSCDCCTPPPNSGEDLCQNVTCPYEQTCNATTNYYCGGIFCQPVAICSSPVFPADPCMLAKCTAGFTCVAALDQCSQNGTLCKLKAQCAVSNRPGSCPNSVEAVPDSCMVGMGCDIGFDAHCPTNRKCCLSQQFQNTNFCLPVPTVPV